MTLPRRWLALLAGSLGLAGLVYLLAAVLPMPRVVLEAEARTNDTTALFWSEIEGFEALERLDPVHSRQP